MILQVIIAMVAGWINRHQQQVIAYQQEEIRILKAKLGKRRIGFTDTERRRLALLAHPLGRKNLQATATLATPDTLMRWYKPLVADKFDGSQKRNQLGRPRVPVEVEQHVIRMAHENPSWGYRRIQGAVANLGHHIELHWEVLAATDFFTVEVAIWQGLVTSYVLVVMELSTRRVEIAGSTPHPNAAFMQQCARQLTDHFDGFLAGKRYLIHDRDNKFTEAFDQYLRDHGVEPVVLPPQSPNLNAHCERIIRSIREEAVGRMIFMGDASLRYTLTQYLARYHSERNHQGLANELIAPEPEVGWQRGQVRRRARLGGLLSYYCREAA